MLWDELVEKSERGEIISAKILHNNAIRLGLSNGTKIVLRISQMKDVTVRKLRYLKHYLDAVRHMENIRKNKKQLTEKFKTLYTTYIEDLESIEMDIRSIKLKANTDTVKLAKETARMNLIIARDIILEKFNDIFKQLGLARVRNSAEIWRHYKRLFEPRWYYLYLISKGEGGEEDG